MPDSNPRIQQFRRGLSACLAIYWCALVLAIHWPMPFHASHYVRFDDKFVHVGLYGGLALILLPLAEFLLPTWPAWRRSIAVIVTVALQGGLDELTQPLTHRTTDIFDLMADTCGAILAVLIYRAWVRRIFVRYEPRAVPPS